jgi:hypothetical protein
MIMHPAEGKGFFHGLHLLNAGTEKRFCFYHLTLGMRSAHGA